MKVEKREEINITISLCPEVAEDKRAVMRAWLRQMHAGKDKAVSHYYKNDLKIIPYVDAWEDFRGAEQVSLGYTLKKDGMEIMAFPREVQDAWMDDYGQALFFLTAMGHLAVAALDFGLIANMGETGEDYMERIFEFDDADMGYFFSGREMHDIDPYSIASASVLAAHWVIDGTPSLAYYMAENDCWDGSFECAGTYCKDTGEYLPTRGWSGEERYLPSIVMKEPSNAT